MELERRLDPDIGRILPVLPLKDAANLTPKRARDELVALTDRRKDVPLPQPAVVVDITVDGAPGSIPARMYRASTAATATVVFFHGGGWVAGDLYTHDRHLRALSLALDAVVLSVDYRRAPEAPFPAAFEDALAATRWAAKNIAQLGGDASRVAVAGDSAGGQLAASVALACRDDGPRLKAQLLVYPATDVAGAYLPGPNDTRYPSRKENAEGFFLSTEAMRFFARQYLPRSNDGLDWRVSPIRASSFMGLLPTLVCTAEFDPLRDEDDAYARVLAEAGVEVAHFREPGMIHAYFELGAISAAAEAARLRAWAAFEAMINS